MTEAIIPPFLINPFETVGDNIIEFVVKHGTQHRIDKNKPAKINVDGMFMEFDQTTLFLATKDMKIKIIQ